MSKRVIDATWAQKQLESISAVSPHRAGDRQVNMPYLKSAATLDVFTRDLVPLDGKGTNDALEHLRDFSRPASMPDGQVVWRLTDDQRGMITKRLTTDEMITVIKQNPDRIKTSAR